MSEPLRSGFLVFDPGNDPRVNILHSTVLFAQRHRYRSRPFHRFSQTRPSWGFLTTINPVSTPFYSGKCEILCYHHFFFNSYLTIEVFHCSIWTIFNFQMVSLDSWPLSLTIIVKEWLSLVWSFSSYCLLGASAWFWN